MKLGKEERANKIREKAKATQPNDSWRTRPELQKENADWVTDAIIIAHKIMDALDDQALTQRDLAERLEVSPQAVNKIVKGRQNLTLGTIRKIERALDIHLVSLRSGSILGVEARVLLTSEVSDL